MKPIKEHCVCDARPDYESEYYRLMEQIKKLHCENQELRNTIIGMCKALQML